MQSWMKGLGDVPPRNFRGQRACEGEFLILVKSYHFRVHVKLRVRHFSFSDWFVEICLILKIFAVITQSALRVLPVL